MEENGPTKYPKRSESSTPHAFSQKCQARVLELSCAGVTVRLAEAQHRISPIDETHEHSEICIARVILVVLRAR